MGDLVADGMPYEPPLSARNVGYSNTPATTEEALDAGLGFGAPATFERLTEQVQTAGTATPSARGGFFPAQQSPEITRPADELNELYAPEGEKLFTAPMTDSLARLVGQQRADEIDRENTWSRWANVHSWPVTFGASVALSLADPLNDAAMFVPGVGESVILGRFGIKAGEEGLAAKLAAKAVSGGSGVAAGMGPVIAANYLMNRAEGQDYSLRDAFSQLAINSVIGAALHTGLGRVDYETNAFRGAAAQLADGKPVDVEPILKPNEHSPADIVSGQRQLNRDGYAPGMSQSELESAKEAVNAPEEITKEPVKAPSAAELEPQEETRIARLQASGMSAEDAFEQMALEDAAAEKHPAVQAAMEKLGDIRAAISGTAQRIGGGVQPGGERPSAIGRPATELRPEGAVVPAVGKAGEEAVNKGAAGQGAAASPAAERAGLRAAGAADPELALAERELAASGPIHPEDQAALADAQKTVDDADARSQAYAQAGVCLNEALA